MKRFVLGGLMAMAPVMAMAQSSLQTAPCNGSYVMHFGKGREAATGMPVGAIGQFPVTVVMGQCGREMVLNTPQGSVVMAQSIMDAQTFVGMVNFGGDGVARELHLTRGPDRNLRGGLRASDGQLAISRPIWLMAETLQETAFEGCMDDAASPPPRGITNEERALGNVLARAGFAPADGYQMADYIDASAAGAGSRSVMVPLNINSQMIPRSDVAMAEIAPERAMCEEERLDPMWYMLEFKISTADQDVFVFARVIEVETGKIHTQVEGMPPKGNPTDLAGAMSDALGKLDWGLGAMKGAKS